MQRRPVDDQMEASLPRLRRLPIELPCSGQSIVLQTTAAGYVDRDRLASHTLIACHRTADRHRWRIRGAVENDSIDRVQPLQRNRASALELFYVGRRVRLQHTPPGAN